MNARVTNTLAVFAAGVAAGIAIEQIPAASAASEAVAPDLGQRKFHVFINEVRQNFVFGDEFAKGYSKTVTLSDGSRRSIELTPMIHNGMQVVEFKDTGFLSYMSLNGTTTNGKLMVQIVDETTNHRDLKEQGWKLP